MIHESFVAVGRTAVGALVGGATGAVIGAGSRAALGGNIVNGAIEGGVAGAVSGGIAANGSGNASAMSFLFTVVAGSVAAAFVPVMHDQGATVVGGSAVAAVNVVLALKTYANG